MKEYFISEINIEKLYHLSNITIELDTTKRQHLLLTGKNGSGKTSLLLRLVRYLKVLKDGHLIRLTRTWPELEEDAKRKMEHASSENERFKAEQDYWQWSDLIRKYSDGIRVAWNDNDGLESAYQKGEFITAYFPAERKAQFAKPNGVENIKLSEVYDTTENAGNILLKYMVHMKTQQSFARNEGDQEIVERIQQWFDRFESALQVLLDEKSIHLEVWRPLDYLEEVRKCNANHVFIQTAHLSEAQQVIQIYQQAGIPTGISINVLDQSRPDFYALLTLADEILVATAYPDDPEQCYQNEMEKLALKLAAEGKKVWIDGGVTAEIYSKLADSSLTAAVMGRAVFKNKEQAVKQFCQNR